MSSVEHPGYTGLVEATARLHNIMGGQKEIDRLPKYLHEGEAVVELAVGMVKGNAGVLALTDQRILFVFEGLTKNHTRGFHLEDVKAISETYKGAIKHPEIEVFACTSGRKRKELALEGVDENDARRFVIAAHDRIGGDVPFQRE